MKKRRKGLLWSVLIIWINFPFLYWGVLSDKPIVISIGLLITAIGTGFTLVFG